MKRSTKLVANRLLGGVLVFLSIVATASAQTKPPNAAEAAAPDLASEEARLAEKFNRLELLAGRLAELSRSTQPRRARLLRELISKSREQDIAGRFDSIVKALREDRLATASENQGELQAELEKLLELLLREDRQRKIESERKRIAKYLAELKKLIRQQRGIKARTDGGDQTDELTKDQQRVAKQTESLQKQIEKAEGPSRPASGSRKDAKSQEGKDKPANSQQSESSPPHENGKPGDSGSKPSKPSESKKGQPSEGKPSDSPSQGQPGPSSESEPKTPSQRATERLQKAQQRMQQATDRLEEAKRKNAAEEQEQALRELEQAKAELERILRQLREEELERMLVLLEARFRKMLDAQTEVYEETQKLDATQAKAQTHELEIASGRLSRKERQIVHEADRALILLREDGTSVAFPEALEQARDDMQAVVDRLANVKLGEITQGLEEDIIATLEEILASLQQAIKDLRKQQARQQPGEGQPGEQPLVDQLAELRMIRALQARVNRRTVRYEKMIGGEQALEAELLEALDRLAIREERIYEATRDLDTGRNQ